MIADVTITCVGPFAGPAPAAVVIINGTRVSVDAPSARFEAVPFEQPLRVTVALESPKGIRGPETAVDVTLADHQRPGAVDAGQVQVLVENVREAPAPPA